MTDESDLATLAELDHPEQSALTRRFQLGRPRGFRIIADANLVLFLRSDGPLDPVLHLWGLDLATGKERRIVDATSMMADDEDLPAEERARRERAREAASGIVQFSASSDGRIVAFTIAGRLFSADVASGRVVEEPAPGGAYDAQVDPSGRRIGFVQDGRFHMVARGVASREVVGDSDPDVTWGVADFVAAEEMGRQRGYWWSPDGERVLVARVDNRPVASWNIGDPANPHVPARSHRYPAAGTANAVVTLAIFGVADGQRVDVTWDRDTFPYLASVRWSSGGPCLLLVQSRDQRRLVTLSLDADDGSTSIVDEQTGDPWVEVPVGTPRWLTDGRLLTTVDDLDAGRWGTRRLAIDGVPVTPQGLQVAAVAGQDEEGIWFTAHTEPTEVQVHRIVLGEGPAAPPVVSQVTEGAGMHGVAASAGTQVLWSTSSDSYDLRVQVRRGDSVLGTIASRHAIPRVSPMVAHLSLGPDELRAGLLLPTDDDGESPLPVVLDPYGGPHAQRVVRSRMAFATSQWIADQGFAVLVCDGRGTPARGPRWEHRIHGDFADGVLEDQVTALHAAAEVEPRLDLGRVGIRGWSFGGYLAALAVLRRPDVFRAAVAGAPVTDWRLYDTHYTERYLGHPDEEPAAYRASSLVDDHGLVDAAVWSTPWPRLMVIHGLADDNVVAAHSLRLSSALLAAGRQHTFLPLSGVTHMTPQVTVASNLARLELAFLVESLAAG